MQVFTDSADLAAAHPDLTDTSHHIAVTSGTDVTGYVDKLNKDLTPLGVTAQTGGLDGGSDMVVTLNALSAILALVATIAFINTFNRLNVIVQQPAGDYQPGQFG